MATEGSRGGLLEKFIPFLAAGRERAALRNDAMRARIEGLENQNRAATELEGLFSSQIGERERLPSFELEGLLGDDGTVAPSTPVHNLTRPEDRGLFEIQTPEGQAQAQGLLAHLAPQQLGSSLLGSPNERTNATRQKIQAFIEEGMRQGLEGDPLNEFVNKNLTSTGRPLTPLEIAMMQSQLDRNNQALADAQEDASTEADMKTRVKKESDDQMRSTATNLLRLSELNDSLFAGSTLTQPGLPAADLRRNTASLLGPLASTAGFDEFGNSLSQGAAEMDEFTSLSNEIAIDRIDISGFNAGTEGKFNFFTSTKPSAELLGPANDAATSRMFKGLLLKDDHDKVFSDIERQAIESRVKELDARSKSTEDTPPTDDSENAALDALKRNAQSAVTSGREAASDLAARGQSAASDLAARGQSAAVDLTRRGGAAFDAFSNVAEKIQTRGLETVTDIRDQLREAQPTPEELVKLGEVGIQDLNDYIELLKLPDIDVPDKAGLLRRAEESRKFLEKQVEAAREMMPAAIINFSDLPD